MDTAYQLAVSSQLIDWLEMIREIGSKSFSVLIVSWLAIDLVCQLTTVLQFTPVPFCHLCKSRFTLIENET